MCAAQKNAPASSTASEVAREKASSLGTHKRYRAGRASSRASQVVIRVFLPRNTPSTGTSTTYRAVRNPAFPAPASPTPDCWSREAINRIRPSTAPDAACRPVKGTASRLFSRSIRGSTATAPRVNRQALKVKGCK